MTDALNVNGEPLQPCSMDPLTGFYRDGCCNTGPQDLGRHLVCAQLTDEFLEYSRQRGNDLVTPRPEYGFPGLKAGDQWCLCVDRWREALAVHKAPPVMLASTHMAVLDRVDLETLRQHALDAGALH